VAQGWAAGKGQGPAPQAALAKPWSITPLWQVQARGKAFVDFQNDATAADIALAKAENFQSVEHLKRYTTLGMAPDQGKTSNVNALAIMAELTGRSVQDTGTTRFRPPFTPTAIAAFGGASRGELFRPKRHLVLHDHHQALGAVFEDYGNWQRPAYYLRSNETPHRAEQREALCVRQNVGIFDSSTLGKIEVVGPDAGLLLDRFYANRMSNLKVGRLRYGLMLNELGVIIDDGVCARLAEDRFLVGTTSSGAGKIAASLDEWRQCEWPELRVLIVPVTTVWNVITLTGPKARALLTAAQIDTSISAEDFPHMSFKMAHVAGIPARVFRVSYTGEISYEINVQGDDVITLWQRLMELGPQFGLMPIGIDAWQLLRTEKGFLHIGADTDGSTVPDDVGWGHVLKRADDFIGKRSLTQPGNNQSDRLQFVGLEPVDGDTELSVGGHVRGVSVTLGSEGYITSAGHSPILGRSVALGMVRAGRARLGEIMTIVTGVNKGMSVRIAAPDAYDPKGERLAS
jgi:sarcosine oxidase subunit alpha